MFLQFREREAIRLCLKHFRQKNYNEVFASLQKKTKIQLEHPRLTELHNSLVKDGNYEEPDRLVNQAIKGKYNILIFWPTTPKDLTSTQP